MFGAFASVILLCRVFWLMRPGLGFFQGIPVFPGRRRRYASVVAGQGLAISYCEVDASRILKSLVRLVCALGNGASTSLAKRVST